MPDEIKNYITTLFIFGFAWCLIWAMICGFIDSAKGRDGGSVFLGLLLGPVGAIIALCKKNKKDLVPCRFCKEDVNTAAEICPHCRSNLVQPPRQKIRQDSVSENT